MSDGQEMRLCGICGDPNRQDNRPATHRMRVGPWVLYFCDEDYMLVKQFVKNFANIKTILHQSGIHIGVPDSFKLKRNAS